MAARGSARLGYGRRRRVLGLALGLVALAAAAPARAQNAITIPVSITINPVLYLSSTGSFAFPAPGDAHYTAGYVPSSSGPTLTHHGNVPYRITIAAQTGSTLGFAALAGRSDANPNRPTTDLTLQATTGGSGGGYVQLAPAGSSNTLYTRSSAGGDLQSLVDARLALGWTTNPPGTYTTTVVFTIIAP